MEKTSANIKKFVVISLILIHNNRLAFNNLSKIQKKLLTEILSVIFIRYTIINKLP